MGIYCQEAECASLLFQNLVLSELEHALGALHVCVGNLDITSLLHRTLRALAADFLRDAEREGVVRGGSQGAPQLAAVGRQHLDVVADVLLPLTQHLEGRSYPRGTNLKTVIFHFAVELTLNLMCELHATLYVDAAVGVYLHCYLVVGPYLEIDQKTIAPLKARLDELAKCLSVYHCESKKRRRPFASPPECLAKLMNYS